MNSSDATQAPRLIRADAARNQQRIVAAARELFADHGLAITLDDVAHRAGVGVGTVYRRFGNKSQLINAVFAQGMSELTQAAEAAGRHPDPWLGLVRFLEYVCREMAANGGMREVIRDYVDMKLFADVRGSIKPILERIVDRARDVGELDQHIGVPDIFAIIQMVAAAAEFARPVCPEAAQRCLIMALNGLRADTRPRIPLTVPPLTDDQIEQAKVALCASRRRGNIREWRRS